MTARTAKYGHPKDLAAWRTETAYSHPCWGTATPYWASQTQSPRTVPAFSGRRLDTAFCASNLLRGLAALDAMTESPDWEERLLALGRRFDELQTQVPPQAEPDG